MIPMRGNQHAIGRRNAALTRILAALIAVSLFFPPQAFGQVISEEAQSEATPVNESDEVVVPALPQPDKLVPLPTEPNDKKTGGEGGPNPNQISDPPYRTVQPNADIKQVKPGVDLSSGALTYRYPFTLPPGRNGFTPEFSLVYNSQDRKDGSLAGYGWNLSIPYIVRENRYGNDLIYDVPLQSFSSSIDGSLVLVSGNQYAAKNDNSAFNQYTRFGGLTSRWELKNKKGETYFFGSSLDSQQTSPQATSTGYLWMLDKMLDANGNEIRFTYFKDQGQVYLDKIQYLDVNPGSFNFVFIVQLNWEPRQDIHSSYLGGFEVKTAKRLQFLDIKENGIPARRYNLGYINNFVNNRSLLDYVEEVGDPVGSGIIALPPTRFTYTPNTTGSFSLVSNANGPFPPTDPDINALNYTRGVIVTDVNGDGYADVLQSLKIDSPAQEERHVWINNHDSTFTESGTWQIPNVPGTGEHIFICRQTDPAAYCFAKGVVVFDIQGDLLSDFVHSDSPAPQSSKAYLNSGSGWSHNPLWDGQIDTLNPLFITRPSVIDLNGDGLPDYLEFLTGGTAHAYKNTGSSMYSIFNLGSSVPDQLGLRALDLNNDGLSDIYRAYEYSQDAFDVRVFINKSIHSTGFTEDSNWSPLPAHNTDMLENYYAGATRTFLADLNGDDLPDLISDTGNAHLHQWNGWTSAHILQIGADVPGVARQVGDINGDGLLEVFYNVCNPACTTEIFYNISGVPDMLSKITLPAGGEIAMQYKSSAGYKDQGGNLLNPSLPLTIQTVNSVNEKDPVIGAVGTTTYEYAGGSYYFNNPHDRKFAGFETVTETRPDGSKRISYFHQGNATNSAVYEYDDHQSKIGKPFRNDIVNQNGILVSRATTKWEKTSSATSTRFFVYPVQQITEDYDGNGTHKDNATEFVFNTSTGNLEQEKNWGEVNAPDPLNFTDVGGDDVTTNYEYATGPGIMSLRSHETVLDELSAVAAETKTYYDSLAFGQALKGNPTKNEYLIQGSAYASITRTYNSFGLVLEERDPNNNPATYTPYDSFNIYPATITNALGQPTQYIYDYTAGKPTRVTDPNGEVRETVYDSLDRVMQEKAPNPSTGGTVMIKQISYVDSANNTSFTETDFLSGTLSTDKLTYLDGFGRVLQIRARAEDQGGPTYAARDFDYDTSGRLEKESLPYFSAGVGRTPPTANQSLYTTYAYDAKDRIITASNAVGATVTVYDDWKEAVTDPEGNQKRFTREAFSRLAAVEEFLPGSGGGSNTHSIDLESASSQSTLKDEPAGIDITGDITIEVWVKPESLAADKRIVAMNAPGEAEAANVLFLLSVADATGKLSWLHEYGAGNNELLTSANSFLAVDTWTHLAAVRDAAAKTIQLFKDGSLIETLNYTNNATGGTNGDFRVGADSGGNEFDGKIDDVRVWDDKRTPAEISANYNRELVGNETNFVGYWQFDNSYNDLTTNNNHLTGINNPVFSTDVPFGGAPSPTIFTTSYRYGVTGNLTKITDAAGNIRNFTYDKLGRRLSAEDLHASSDTTFGTSTFSYDFAGNLTQKKTPKNDIIIYGYDALNRPITEDFTGASCVEVTYGYDNCTRGIGRLCSETKNGFSASYTYDYAGNKSTENKTIWGSPYATSYTYDFQGNPLTVTNPNSSVITYSYNQGGRVETASHTPQGGAPGTIISNIDYAPTGEVALQVNGNNTQSENIYDANELYRLREKKLTSGVTALQKFLYNYDAIGNITHIVISSDVSTTTNRIADYGYDGLYRLTSANITASTTQNSYSESFTYNSIGNILTSPQGTYLYQGNQGSNFVNPHAATSIGSLGLSYDQNGNLTYRAGLEGISHFWDYGNRLVKIEIPVPIFEGGMRMGGSFEEIPPTTAYYTYDPAGMRITTNVWGSATTTYPTPYFNTDGTTIKEHVVVNGIPVATVEKIGTGNPTLFWNSQDHLQSTSVATNNSAQIAESVEYRAFGSLKSNTGSHREQRKYTGHEYDNQIRTNYTYAKARYLNTEWGRFLSEDAVFLKIGDRGLSYQTRGSVFDTGLSNVNEREALEAILKNPQALNSYSYVTNNPLKYRDESGEVIQIAAGVLIRGAVLGAVGGVFQTALVSNGTASVGDYVKAGLKGAGIGVAGTFGVLVGATTELIADLRESKSQTGSYNIGGAIGEFGVTVLVGATLGSGAKNTTQALIQSELTSSFLKAGVQKAAPTVQQNLSAKILELQALIAQLQQKIQQLQKQNVR